MKKIKKFFIIFLCLVIFTENTATSTFAVNIPDSGKSQYKDVVYLTDGEGSEELGDGTKNNPYKNINTALKNVAEGGTIKIVKKVMYWYYEEHKPTLLPLPLIINKSVTFEGESGSEVFCTRAPIQLAADVTFKNITMEFWASNELMPGVPDPGLPQTPRDEWTKFRSGRTIYLAGNELTLDNVDTRINTTSFQRDYRPYISGGTFLSGGAQGSKSVLNVINPNEGTQFAGIYAGDYWKEADFSVDININGKIIDNTIHTGGIIEPFHGDVTVKINNKVRTAVFDTTNHTGNVDVIIKSEGLLYNSDFSGVRNLTLESNSKVEFLKDSVFEVNNLTLERNANIDFTKINGNAIVKGDFIGDIDSDANEEGSGGIVYLNKDQVLDIKGDVKGVTLLNSDRKFNILELNENHTYVKAKENASGDFKIYPKSYQKGLKLVKDNSNSFYTTWTVVEKDTTFRDFRWSDSYNENIVDVREGDCYIYEIDFINKYNEVYLPREEDLEEFLATLKKPDGTILDLNNDSDSDLMFMLGGNGVYIFFNNDKFVGEIILTVTHKSSKSITKKIQVGEIITPPEESSIIQEGDFIFDKEDGFIKGYVGNDEVVTIPSQVAGISVEGIDANNLNGEHQGFYGNTNIKKIIFEDGIKYIGSIDSNVSKGVFQECVNLEEVILPKTLKYIGDNTFNKCTSLKNISIPNNVIQVGVRAFAYCQSIENIELPENLRNIGDSAFGYCRNLRSVILSKNTSFKYISTDQSIMDSKNVFEGCPSLTDINIYYEPTDEEFLKLQQQLLNQYENPTVRVNRIRNEDLNKDNEINLIDLEIILEKFNIKDEEEFYNSHYDFNKDGIIDIYDLVRLANKIN